MENEVGRYALSEAGIRLASNSGWARATEALPGTLAIARLTSAWARYCWLLSVMARILVSTSRRRYVSESKSSARCGFTTASQSSRNVSADLAVKPDSASTRHSDRITRSAERRVGNVW